MKKIGFFAISLFFVITGCNNNSILEPENDYAEKSLSKGRPILVDGSDKMIITNDLDDIIIKEDLDQTDQDLKFNLLGLDGISAADTDELKIKSKYSKNYTVDGSEGGLLSVKHKYYAEKKEKVNLSAKLNIPKDTFRGEL